MLDRSTIIALILSLIQVSDEFAYLQKKYFKNDRYCSIEKQLAVFLYFISRNYMYSDISDLFGFGGSSTVSNIIDRVANSFLELRQDFIRWHSIESQERMLKQSSEYGFDNCIAICDEVVNYITSFDKVYTSSWTTIKNQYGIVSLVMCDPNDNMTAQGVVEVEMTLKYGKMMFCQ